MEIIELYSKAYQLLENRTPVMFDCGELCSSACCMDNGMGMLLFPHEELYISKMNTDFIITDTKISVDGYKMKILYCGGKCDRFTRPLSCRIFPLFPYLYDNGSIVIKFDPRAHKVCPLLLTDIDEIYVSGLFRLMVYKTAVLLSTEPLIRKFLLKMTTELDTMDEFISGADFS